MRSALMLLAGAFVCASLSFAQTIRVGFPGDFPPHYIVQANGELSGFAVDLLQAVLTDTDYEIEWVVYNNWQALIDHYLADNVQVIPNTDISDNQTDIWQFSAPYEVTDLSLFVRSSDNSSFGIEDFADNRLATQTTNIGIHYLQENYNISPLKVPDVERLLQLLVSGSVDGIVYPGNNLQYKIKELGLENQLQKIAPPIMEVSRAMAIVKGFDALQADLFSRLTDFVSTPEYFQLYQRWQASVQLDNQNTMRLSGHDSNTPVFTWFLIAFVLFLCVLTLYLVSRLFRILNRYTKYKMAVKQEWTSLRDLLNCHRWLWNPATEEIKFYSPVEIDGIGRSVVNRSLLAQLADESDVHKLNEFFNALVSGNSSALEIKLCSSDGLKKQWLFCSFDSSEHIPLHGFAVDQSSVLEINHGMEIRQQLSNAYLDLADVMLIAFDSMGVVTMINQKAKEILELDDTVIGKAWFDIYPNSHTHQPIRDLFESNYSNAVTDKVIFNELTLPSGEQKFIEWSQRTISDSNNRILGIIVVGYDKSKEREQKAYFRKTAAVFENIREGIIVTDPQGNIVQVNNAFTRITGYSQDEVIGKNPRILSSGQHSSEFYRSLWKTLLAQGLWAGEVFNRRKNGEIYPEYLTIMSVKDDAGKLTNYIAVFMDLFCLRKAEQKVIHLAAHDSLTGLSSRHRFQEQVIDAMSGARNNHHKFALLFIDVDHFKQINDTYGHHIGDLTLQIMAKRLQKQLRKSDFIARLSGDEFAIFCELMNAREGIITFTDRLLRCAREPIVVENKDIHVSISIGASVFPDDGLTFEDCLQCADAAMYQAKELGRNRMRFYSGSLREKANARAQLEAELRKAVKNDELHVYYQPQIDSASGKIVGVEALVRWFNSSQGEISPSIFIPIAEEIGLIREIGIYVVEQAIKDSKQWCESGWIERLAVNVSPRQFGRSFEKSLLALLTRHNFPATYLELEITESSALELSDDSSDIMCRIQSLGIRWAIDDFGTHYSSLARLKMLPVSVLKIDRQFVMDLPHSEDDMAITSAILALAEALKLQVVAEGVETDEQADFLKIRGCDFLQGFLYSKPISKSDMNQLLHSCATSAKSERINL